MKKYQKSLPVLMHHLISNDTSHISVVPSVFDEQCRTLAEKGWFGVSLKQAEDFLVHGEPLPEKSFLLTFDDGYLDNYAYAWPIMKKYGHKGVVFVVTDRITEAQRDCEARHPDRSNQTRPTCEEVREGKRQPGEMPPIDSLIHTDEFGFSVRQDIFMNWDEARILEASGDIAIAGHSLRHASVFSSPVYSNFFRPGGSNRTFLSTEPQWFWGLPAFERGPEFANNRAFIPCPDMAAEIKSLVPQEKSEAVEFFKSEQNVKALQTIVANYDGYMGHYEHPEQAAERFAGVMQGTQATLCRELGKKSRSFCWPWGVFCNEAREQGRAAGFEVFYTTRLSINRAGSHLEVGRFKVKNRADSWLPGRIRLYSRPVLGGLYLKLRI